MSESDLKLDRLTRSSTRSLMAVTESTTTRGISVVYHGRVEISGIIYQNQKECAFSLSQPTNERRRAF